jgi:leucyl aminopeptidase (aminopeptidase T)
MSEGRKKLKTTVGQLHAELGSMENADEEIRQMLQGAMEDIQLILDQDKQPMAEGDSQHASVVERLSKAAQHYEDRHPTLSGILGSMIDTLSNMGI